MAKLNDYRSGNCFKVSDLGGKDLLVQIESCKPEMVGEGAEAKKKLVLRFENQSRGLVLNNTNLEVLALAFGEDTEDLIGAQVVLTVDPDVRYAGRKVGGIRVRLPQKKKTAAETAAELDDELPI